MPNGSHSGYCPQAGDAQRDVKALEKRVAALEKQTDPRWEKYCRSFLKGCTIHLSTGRTDRPQDCEPCTDAFVKAIQRLKENGYEER